MRKGAVLIGNEMSWDDAGVQGLSDSIEEELWFGDDDPDRTTRAASSSLAAAVGRAAGLRPFPPLAAELMGLLNRGDYDPARVERLIESDPGMTARVLAVSNSAAFMARSRCESVRDALVRLGARTLADIVAGVAAVAMFEEARAPDPAGLKVKVRSHCVGVAALSRSLAKLWRFRGVDQVFLAGLLHDLGKLLSLECGEIAYHEMPAETLTEPNRTHLCERRLVGYDHAILAAHVLSGWNFPESVQRVVAWHHQPGRAYKVGGDIGLMVALLRVADAIDLRLAVSPQFSADWGEQLSAEGTLSYLDFSVGDLEQSWSELVRSRHEVIAAVGARG